MDEQKRIENLGPAERIINALLAYTDHMYHNRPGFVVPDARHNIGVRWEYAVPADEEGKRVLNRIVGKGRKATKTKIGEIREDGKVVSGGQVVGEYRPAGIFPEVAAWMYRQVAEVWKLDNEFAARWASYAFRQEHRDLKVVLAAFMLCQSRKGDPVKEGDKVLFHDEDFRDVGEAMALVYDGKDSKKDMSPKMLLRIYEVLKVPAVAEVNRELGFGRSARQAHLGRWEKAVHKWLRFREENPKLLAGLEKAGFKSTVQDLVRITGYKPESQKFFEALRWKQSQAKDGRRTIAIGVEMAAAESWSDLTEEQICERIVRDKPNWKKASSLLPKHLGATRAIVMAAIEAGSFSNKDLIIAMPTLEELGLLQVQEVKERIDRAVREAEDMRAANVAARLRTKEAKDMAQEAADNAVKKAVEEVTRDLRTYFIVDISGSMQPAIEQAKRHIARFLQGFPQDKVHVSVFNTAGREVRIQHASAAGVEQAFRGIGAGGGTAYGEGVRALSNHKPKEDEDSLFVFIGDECGEADFSNAVRASGLRPMAFGLVRVIGTDGHGGRTVQNTAARLGIPCFQIDEAVFADPYAIPRTVRNLIAATPVGAQVGAVQPKRTTLVDTILKTDLLQKPAWAS